MARLRQPDPEPLGAHLDRFREEDWTPDPTRVADMAETWGHEFAHKVLAHAMYAEARRTRLNQGARRTKPDVVARALGA